MATDAAPREVNPTAGSGTAISVMLIVPDVSSAVAWYKRALGARELWNLGGVAGLAIGDAPFFLHEINPDTPSETSPLEAGRTTTRVEMFVDDPDAVLERALSAGATLGFPIEEHVLPWGTHRQGAFTIRSATFGRSETKRRFAHQRPDGGFGRSAARPCGSGQVARRDADSVGSSRYVTLSV